MVNNAVYLHYLEHARHEVLRAWGVDFAGWAARGVYLVVTRIEVDYLLPLRSGDQFWLGTNTQRVSPLRFAFLQDIYRRPDDKPVLRAKVIGTAINDQGRPRLPAELAQRFADAGPEDSPASP
jgi:acyl-CoA thioester hydrolase